MSIWLFWASVAYRAPNESIVVAIGNGALAGIVGLPLIAVSMTAVFLPVLVVAGAAVGLVVYATTRTY
jgi:hypothetical protein